MIFSATLWFYVGLPAMLAALLFRGGLLLYVTGVTFVRRDGLRASRLRIFWRSVVAWAPLWLIFFVSAMNMEKPGTWSVPVVCTLVLALTLASLWLPRRGVPDRLAGTWPVPR
jgi:hypothetical protein